jgi:predicted nucleotidyltransferase
MNNNFGIYDTSFLSILKTIKEIDEIEKAIIFGSRAMGNYKKGSDIDLAIIGKNVNYKIITHLSNVLNEELPIPYYTDVLDYNSLSNIELKEHIDIEGKVIYRK